MCVKIFLVIIMNLPQRKLNRLENFDYNQNSAYFITVCVNDRKQILSNIVVGTGVSDCQKVHLLEHEKIAEKYINHLL